MCDSYGVNKLQTNDKLQTYRDTYYFKPGNVDRSKETADQG